MSKGTGYYHPVNVQAVNNLPWHKLRLKVVREYRYQDNAMRHAMSYHRQEAILGDEMAPEISFGKYYQ